MKLFSELNYKTSILYLLPLTVKEYASRRKDEIQVKFIFRTLMFLGETKQNSIKAVTEIWLLF